MKVINRTPHIVKVGDVEFKSEGEPLRLQQVTESAGYLIGNCRGCDSQLNEDIVGDIYCPACGEICFGGVGKIPLSKTRFEQAEGLPVQIEGTYYIVSSILCQAYTDRNDFLIVNETVRNERGEIVGCKSLAINPFLKVSK